MPDTNDHKLVIKCPVADNPEIFSQINGSIVNLQHTIADVRKIAEEGTRLGKDANKKVDRIYIVLGFIAAMIPIIGVIWHIVKP